MNRILIPLILATTLIASFVFMVTPIQKASTVHQSIQAFISTEHDNALIAASGTLSATMGANSRVTLLAPITGSSINPGVGTVTITNLPPGGGLATVIVSVNTDVDNDDNPDDVLATLTVANNSSGSVTVAFMDGLRVECTTGCATNNKAEVVGTMLVRP